jgi:hypothetical protein
MQLLQRQKIQKLINDALNNYYVKVKVVPRIRAVQS